MSELTVPGLKAEIAHQDKAMEEMQEIIDRNEAALAHLAVELSNAIKERDKAMADLVNEIRLKEEARKQRDNLIQSNISLTLAAKALLVDLYRSNYTNQKTDALEAAILAAEGSGK